MDDGRFMERLMRSLQGAGADDVVISSINDDSIQLKFANSTISTTKSWNTQDIVVFAAVRGRTVSTSIKDLSEASLRTATKRIIAFADSLAPNREYEGIAKGPFSYAEVEGCYDPKVRSFGEEAPLLVERAIRAAAEEGVARSAGTLRASAVTARLISSGDVDVTEDQSGLYFSFRAMKDDEASGHAISVGRSLGGFDTEAAATRAARIAMMAQSPKTIVPGKYEVLFDHLAIANLLSVAGSAASIFSVESGLSFFKGKLGKRVASPIVSLYDDPRLPGGFGSSKFDAEGVPTRTTPIIEDGAYRNYLHNTSTAKRYKTETTANAGIISPSPHQVVMSAGDASREELIGRMRKGIYITNVWYTRFQNYETGAFSTIPRDGAFYVEDGEIKHPVKGIRLSENILNILAQVQGISKERRQVQGWEVDVPVLAPLVLTQPLNITRPGS
ncbi:TldD/PmbA family protein [Candidatus Woesearchaeota archaeon]|nr:TldD/PmbA family protein [Candidatus Woesearchaeota archaeon]